MKREIKFRAWDKSKRLFLPIDVYAVLNRTPFGAFGVMIMDWENYKEGEFFYDDAQELSQFTGLNDKNGNEIYEGDILNTGHIIKFVNGAFFAYKEGQATLPYTPENHYPLYRWDTDAPIGGAIVIGNIYENSELLKA